MDTICVQLSFSVSKYVIRCSMKMYPQEAASCTHDTMNLLTTIFKGVIFMTENVAYVVHKSRAGTDF